ILRVISGSPTDVQPVYDTIAESAVRLCDALFCLVYRFDGELIHPVAHHNFTSEALDVLGRIFPSPPGPDRLAARSVGSRSAVHVEDVLAEAVPPEAVRIAEMLGFRTQAAVPMLREGQPVGVISVARRDKRLFTEQQIELIRTFADQA